MTKRSERLGRGLQLVAVTAVASLFGAAASPLTASDAPTAGITSGRPEARRANNVIFFNGDGMSLAMREAGRLHLAGLTSELQMNQLGVRGTLSTDPRDPVATVTDSAAGATAWATGQKSYNGAVSVDINRQPLPNIGQYASSQGKSTGLVTTAQVTDASPAAFFSQTADRGRQSDIALQYLTKTKPDVILGGGEDWWYPAGDPGVFADNLPEHPTEASRSTRGNLVRRAQSLGYDYVTSAQQLQQTRSPKVLGLFANEEQFQPHSEGQADIYDPAVPLATMTQKALDILGQDPRGFFLFVEEEGTDEFGASNNGEKVLYSLQQLEAAVAVARRYVAQHPDTLLIVAADHEVGGLAIEDPTGRADPNGSPMADGPFSIKGSTKTFNMDWTTGNHTGGPTPVTAAGPGSEQLTGQHPNTFLYGVLRAALRRRHR